MNFKKFTQVVWMILAHLFIAVFFLRVYSDSIYIVKAPDSSIFYKHNKLTGAAYVINSSKAGIAEEIRGKWVRITN